MLKYFLPLSRRSGWLLTLLLLGVSAIFSLAGPSLLQHVGTKHALLAYADQTGADALYLFPCDPGEFWQTMITLTNLENRKVEVDPFCYHRNGDFLGNSPFIESLKAEGTQTIKAEEIGVPSCQTFTLEADGKMVGALLLTSLNGEKSEAIPAMHKSAKQLDFPPLLEGDTEDKTITLLNPGFSSANLEVIALDPDGGQLEQTFLPPLSSRESRTFAVKDLFSPESLYQLSTVRVISDNSIVGLQLVDSTPGDLVGLPALTSTSYKWSFPILTMGGDVELWTTVGLFNPGEVSAFVSIEAFDAEDASLGIIETTTFFPGAIYDLHTANMEGIIPQEAAVLKVTADEPIIGYTVIGAVEDMGVTAALGIPAEDQIVAGFEIIGSADGSVLKAYPMIGTKHGASKSTVESLGEDEIRAKIEIKSLSSVQILQGSKTGEKSTTQIKGLTEQAQEEGVSIGQIFIGNSPPIANSSAVLYFSQDIENEQGFRWISSDSILYDIDTEFISATMWVLVGDPPARLVFRGSGDGATIYGNVLFEPYNRAVVDVVKDSKRVRYLLTAIKIEIITGPDFDIPDEPIRLAPADLLNDVFHNDTDPDEPIITLQDEPYTPPFIVEVNDVIVKNTNQRWISNNVTSVTLQIFGSGFTDGADVEFGHPDISVNSINVISPSEIEVAIDVATGATLEATWVKVINPDGIEAFSDSPSGVALGLDFGTEESVLQPGFARFSPAGFDPLLGYGYTDISGVAAFVRVDADSLLRDGHASEIVDGHIRVTLDNGRYQGTLYFGDNDQDVDVGPFSVHAEGNVVAEDLTIPAGTFSDLSFDFVIQDGELNLDFVRSDGSMWAVNGLVIRRIDGTGIALVTPSGVAVNEYEEIEFEVIPDDLPLSPDGQISLVIPESWTAPQVSNPTAEGYVTATGMDGASVSTVAIEGRTILVNTNVFEPGQRINVLYGDKSGSGPGSRASEEGAFKFPIQTRGSNGVLKSIRRIPEISVVDSSEAPDEPTPFEPLPQEPIVEQTPPPDFRTEEPVVFEASKFKVRIKGNFTSPEEAIVEMLEGESVVDSKMIHLMPQGGDLVSEETLLLYHGDVESEAAQYFESQGLTLIDGEPDIVRVKFRTVEDPKGLPQTLQFFADSAFSDEIRDYRRNKKEKRLWSPKRMLVNNSSIYIQLKNRKFNKNKNQKETVNINLSVTNGDGNDGNTVISLVETGNNTGVFQSPGIRLGNKTNGNEIHVTQEAHLKAELVENPKYFSTVVIDEREFAAEWGNNYAAARTAGYSANYIDLKRPDDFCMELRNQLVGNKGKYFENFMNGDKASDREHWRNNPNGPEFVERADVVAFSGHGPGGSLVFPRATGTGTPIQQFRINAKDMSFGEFDLDYVFTYTCNFNKTEDKVLANILKGGCHLIAGYETLAFIKPAGKTFGQLLLSDMTIAEAWHEQEKRWKSSNHATVRGQPYVAITSVVGLKSALNDKLPKEGNKGVISSADFEGPTNNNIFMRSRKNHKR
ncbi:MAG: hypothetical protein JRE23_10945 [Deltaproteobacteria bacterium]|nr:hypothetical protein [Deltaproteobacteria bacterium]